MSWLIDMDPGALFGEGARFQTGKKMKALGGSRVLLIVDGTMKQLGFAEEMVNILKEAELEVVEYEAETREPSTNMINACRDFAIEQKIDSIVALGGGAVIDISKCTGKLLANGGNLEDYLGYDNRKPYKRFSPIICLPTTAGTGAEINHGCSIFNDVTQKKGNTLHPATLAITDPYYTYNCPKGLTAVVGIDALAHATETLCNSQTITHWMSDTLAKEAVTLCFKYLPAAYETSDKEARDRMAYAAEIAGWAIKMRKTTFGHACGHRFANKYHWPHGVCCGIGLSAVVRYTAECDPYTIRILAQCIGIDCPEDADMVEVGKKVVAEYDKLMKLVGMKSMKEMGVPEDFIDFLKEDVSKDPKWIIVPNPPDFEKMAKAFHDAYDY